MLKLQKWNQIQNHYGGVNIADRIITRLQLAGCDLDKLNTDDTAKFDEFHGGGRDSTLALAKFANISPGKRILDIGSGVGGPARTLAEKYRCQVTGLELTAEFISAGKMLTELLGMLGVVEFVQASATEIPFKAEMFDVVWSQNMLMNVQDKEKLFSEVYRITKPGGMLAFETIVAGPGGPLHFPTFWAADSSMNFLESSEKLCNLITAAGFNQRKFEDTTNAVIENGRRRLKAANAANCMELDLSVIVKCAVAEKMENSVCNNIEGRPRAVQGLFQRLD